MCVTRLSSFVPRLQAENLSTSFSMILSLFGLVPRLQGENLSTLLVFLMFVFCIVGYSGAIMGWKPAEKIAVGKSLSFFVMCSFHCESKTRRLVNNSDSMTFQSQNVGQSLLQTLKFQWNLSNADILGTKIIVLVSELSLFQGENNIKLELGQVS